MPIFARPSAGDFPTGNLFDHDKPAPPESGGADAPDPWEDDPLGAASLWLWRAGEAPALR
jgi:hypothetical protein